MVHSRHAGRLVPPVFFLLLIAACSAFAQDYRIGPEDTLTITVVDHPELGGTLVVATDGSIQVPVIGQLPVVGKTIPQVTDALTKGFLKRLKAPEVYVILAARNPQVYAIGAVARPGVFPLIQNHTALELLVSAGSLSQPVELCSARILRKATGVQDPISLVDLLAGKPAANLALLEGDVLIVEAQPAVPVYVAGDVEAPGVYQVPQGGKLSLALGMARGLTGNPADLRGSILRKGLTIAVDLVAVYAPGGAGDVPLQAGDVVRIESTLVNIFIAGDVKLPGAYSAPAGIGVAEALNLAGGLTPAADRTAVMLTHRNGASETVDLTKGPKALADGDRLFVPTALVLVSVTGEVKAPGAYPMAPTMRLSDVLALAGGLTPAAHPSVKLLRANGAVEPLNDLAARITLQSGDRIFVPTFFLTVTVAGEVQAPGAYQLAPTMTLADAVKMAGGATAAGGLKRVQVMHAGGATQTLDLTDDKTLVRDGDRLLIPTQLFEIVVSGEVRTPGAFRVSGALTVRDALALAGGATSAAALDKMQVLHIGGATDTNPDPALVLRAGDRVQVPSTLISVHIGGEVLAPGAYQFAPGTLVADAVLAAGGATPAALVQRVRVWHVGGKGETVDLNGPGVALKDGDRIDLLTRMIGIAVGGEVRTPGALHVAAGATLADALAQAGGLTPAAGDVSIAHLGGAVEQVAKNARTPLKDGDRITVVSAFVTIEVIGEVRRPGSVTVLPTTSLEDVLAMAGGPTTAAALRAVKLAHVGGGIETLDAALAKPTLADGDRITVPSALISVTFSGEIKSPGVYQLGPDMSLADALAMAGGVLPSGAASAIRVAHARGGVENANLAATKLLDGDRVHVPSSLIAVLVAGEVKSPGAYQFAPATTVKAAVLAAGGATAAGAVNRVQVLHVGGVVETVDIAGAGVTLKDGDRILVPSAQISVTVAGEIRTPGAYPVAVTATVADVIAMAGGSTGAGDSVQVTHVGGAVETLAIGDRTVVRDGDRLTVLNALIRVTLAGEVKTPGAYQFAPGTTLAEALTLAGGVTALGAPKAVRIARARGGIVVADATAGPTQLQDGDRVVISAAAMSIAVTGEVKTPGTFAMTVGGSLNDALAIAGGPTPAAALRAVKIARAGGAVEAVDSTAGPVVLRDGDRVIVPTWLLAVVVTGEVRTPGSYQMAPGMTVADLLAQAGGLTMSASLDRIQVLHLGGAGEVIGPDGGKRALKDGDRVLVPTATVAVAVAGEVKTPGQYQLSTQMTVADALAAAGGPTAAAGLDRVRVLHLGGAADVVSVADTKLLLHDGDRITVPTALVNITVSGEVLKPGSFQVNKQMTVADAIAVAGGPAKAASLGKVQLIRAGGGVEIIDASGTHDVSAMAMLRDGDRIVVPTTDGMVSVWGYVKTPGLYPIDAARPFTISEAILKAAGVPDDNVRGVTVTRQVEGKPVAFTFNLAEVMNRTSLKANEPLLPGDTVFVERKRKSNSWRDTLSAVVSIFSLVSLTRNL